jgi:DNA-binding transcriptional ArsR family regulator
MAERKPERSPERQPERKPERKKGRHAYEGLDRVVQEKARLSILTALLARPGGVVFVDLKELCSLTDGNLSRHLTVLQEAGLVELWKGSDTRSSRTQTLIRLSRGGRAQFLAYLEELERVIRDARAGAVREPGPAPSPSGWSPA